MPGVNMQKLMDMIHYIADAAPAGMLGKTKLNKILWFADREMYLRVGRTIAGETYLRFPQGPVSKHLLDAQAQLVSQGKILLKKSKHYTYEQFEYISLADPDISAFTAQEIDIIGRQIAWIYPMTATQISEISHDRTWQIFANGEEIPMFTVLAATTRDATPEDLQWALVEA